MAKFDLIWDDEEDELGNVRHVAEHGLTREEVEGVLYDNNFEIHIKSHSSGNPGTYGYTSTGLYILVIWAEVCDDPSLAAVVTAFETPPRARR